MPTERSRNACPAQARGVAEVFEVGHALRAFCASDPQFLADLEAGGLEARRLRERLRVAQGNAARRRALRCFFTSDPAKLWYLVTSVRAKRCLDEYTPAELRFIAKILSPFRPTAEVAVVTIKHLSPTKSRRLVAFGPKRHALQRMVADALRALHPPLPSQFALEGGVPRALKALDAAVRAGCRFGAHVDVVDFFPSIRLDGLYALLRPLPRSVVENVVWTGERFLRGAPLSGLHAVRVDGPLRGLAGEFAAGSATSPIVGDILMAHLIGNLPDELVKVAYADNLFILGRSRKAIATSLEALMQTALQHPAGPLRLTIQNEQFDPGSSFEFLGHTGAVRRRGVGWEPRSAMLSRYYSLAEGENASIEALCRALTKLPAWRRGYPAWPAGERFAAEMTGRLQVQLFYLSGSRISMMVAASAIARACAANDTIPASIIPAPRLEGSSTDIDERWRRHNEVLSWSNLRLRQIRGLPASRSDDASQVRPPNSCER